MYVIKKCYSKYTTKLSNLNNNKTNNPSLKNMARDLNRYLIKEDIKMATKSRKRCSTHCMSAGNYAN